MQYQVLGPLRVIDKDDAWSISAQKMEAVLATLLVRPNQVVSTKQLVAEIWGDDPPRRATAAIHVYISKLRKFLCASDPSNRPIITRSSGYLLRVPAVDIDYLVFRQLVQEGRSHVMEKNYEEASRTFRSALDLWRGPALSEVLEGPMVTGFVTWLDEIRLECIEMYVDANMRMHRYRELVSVLYGLIPEYPLHESFYHQLMIALHRLGRRGDALRVYRQARDVLIRELGLEPGIELRRLQLALLAQDNDPPLRLRNVS